MEQIGIGLFGVLAIWLSQDKRPRVSRWACWSGLAAQPFWVWTTIKNGQWVILGLTLLYAWSWFKGVRVHWLPLWRAKWAAR
jgi:hypothetical protein